MLVLKVQEDGQTTQTIPLWEGDRYFGRLPPVEGERYQIGKSLGRAAGTISRTHATVRSTKVGDSFEVKIHDGKKVGDAVEAELSDAGVWIKGQAERIQGWVTITPGTEVELLKGYVLMLLQDQDTDRGEDRTVSQEEALAEQVAILKQAVADLSEQLQARADLDSKREETDRKQSAEIQRIDASIKFTLSLAAILLSVFTLVGGIVQLEKEARTEVRDWLGAVVTPLIVAVFPIVLHTKNRSKSKSKPTP